MSGQELDPDALRAAVTRTLAAEEPTVRAWLADALQTLLRDDRGDLGRRLGAAVAETWAADGAAPALRAALQTLVARAVAASPLAGRAAAPARELALFEEPSADGALPPAATHEHATERQLAVPAELLEAPLATYLARDTLPLPATADREGYHAERHFDYWLSGLEDWLRIARLARAHGASLAPGAAFLDLGCASGRLVRHALCQATGLDVWGTDLNERHVTWLLAHLPERLKAFQCTTLPFLPLPDASFELVTALSVFTHIDEFELAWLAELRRILRPGGIAYLTVHTEHTWSRLGPGVTVYEHLRAARDAIREFRIEPELFRAPMPRDKTVFRWVSASLNNTNVFLSRRHLERTWGRFFELREIVTEGCGYQDVVVLRKPG